MILKDDQNNLCYEAGCRWCCGSYAGKEPEEELKRIFQQRTQLYKKLVKKPKDLEKYLKKIEKLQKHRFDEENVEEAKNLELEGIVRCRFIGFIDRENTKLGCMVPAKYKGKTSRTFLNDLNFAMVDYARYGSMLMWDHCNRFLCEAAQMYEGLPKSQRNIVKHYIKSMSWYQANKKVKTRKMEELSFLQILTTLAHCDYVLERMKKKGLSNNRESAINIIKNTPRLAFRLYHPENNKWKHIFNRTRWQEFLANRKSEMPTGEFYINSLKTKQENWKAKKEPTSTYKIIVNLDDEHLVLELIFLKSDFRKEITYPLDDISFGSHNCFEKYYFGNEVVDTHDKKLEINKKGLISDAEYWYDWDDFVSCNFGRKHRFGSVDHQDGYTRRMDIKIRNLKISPGLQKIFSELDSFFISWDDLLDGKLEIDRIVDGFIDEFKKKNK